MNCDVYGVERVHNPDLFDSVQKTGRLKSVKDTCDRNNPIKFIRWLKKGKTVLYATDQDYGLNSQILLIFLVNLLQQYQRLQKLLNRLVVKHTL